MDRGILSLQFVMLFMMQVFLVDAAATHSQTCTTSDCVEPVLQASLLQSRVDAKHSKVDPEQTEGGGSSFGKDDEITILGFDLCSGEKCKEDPTPPPTKGRLPTPHPTKEDPTPLPTKAEPTKACSAHDRCKGLAGDCCPNSSGKMLDCCSSAMSVDQATCTCSTPNQGAAGHNQYQCSDGFSGYCASNEACYATESFTRGDWGAACAATPDAILAMSQDSVKTRDDFKEGEPPKYDPSLPKGTPFTLA